MWFAVSLLFEAQRLKTPEIDLWQESIRLVEAETEDAARRAAEDIGRQQNHTYFAEGTEVMWSFRAVQSIYPLEDFRMETGRELFSRFLRRSEAMSLLTPFD